MSWWCSSGKEDYYTRYLNYPTRHYCCDTYEGEGCGEDKDVICAPCCVHGESSLWEKEKRDCSDRSVKGMCRIIFGRCLYSGCDLVNICTGVITCPVICLSTTIASTCCLASAGCKECCSLVIPNQEESNKCHASSVKSARWATNFFANGMLCSAGLAGMVICGTARLPVDLLVPELCFLCCYRDQTNWWMFRSTRCDYTYCLDATMEPPVPAVRPQRPKRPEPQPVVASAQSSSKSDDHVVQMMNDCSNQSTITMMMSSN